MPCAGRFMCYVCMCIHAERVRVVVVRSFRRSNMTHVEFWSKRCYIPMPLHTSRIDHRCSDAQGLRKAASPWARGERASRAARAMGGR